MDFVIAICVGVGLSAACGLRVFLPMLLLSAAAKFGWVNLAHGFDWVSSWPALVAFGLVLGYVCWTLTEYLGHRFLFHTVFPGRIGERLIAEQHVEVGDAAGDEQQDQHSQHDGSSRHDGTQGRKGPGIAGDAGGGVRTLPPGAVPVKRGRRTARRAARSSAPPARSGG